MMTNQVEPKLTLTGSCLCGEVKFTAHNAHTKVGVCHCSMCRSWTGGPMMAIDCETAVSYEGEEYISLFDSSPWAERGFCSKCGSSLFYRLKESGQTMIPVGLLGDHAQFELSRQVFIDEKPDFYNFENKTHNMTGAEVFEIYGGDSGVAG